MVIVSELVKWDVAVITSIRPSCCQVVRRLSGNGTGGRRMEVGSESSAAKVVRVPG